MKKLPWLTALLTAVACIGAEPRERPRLAPGMAGSDTSVTVAAGRPVGDTVVLSGDDSLQSYLQARSRRPVGLAAIPEIAAVRAEKAAEKQMTAAKIASKAAQAAVVTDPDVLVLPKMEVTGEKVTKLKAQLSELAARQALEERIAAKAEEVSVLDSILNPPFLRLGSYSDSATASLARKRLEVLDWVKLLTLSLAEAKTPADRARIQADIDGLNEMTRHWP